MKNINGIRAVLLAILGFLGSTSYAQDTEIAPHIGHSDTAIRKPRASARKSRSVHPECLPTLPATTKDLQTFAAAGHAGEPKEEEATAGSFLPYHNTPAGRVMAQRKRHSDPLKPTDFLRKQPLVVSSEGSRDLGVTLDMGDLALPKNYTWFRSVFPNLGIPLATGTGRDCAIEVRFNDESFYVRIIEGRIFACSTKALSYKVHYEIIQGQFYELDAHVSSKLTGAPSENLLSYKFLCSLNKTIENIYRDIRAGRSLYITMEDKQYRVSIKPVSNTLVLNYKESMCAESKQISCVYALLHYACKYGALPTFQGPEEAPWWWKCA